MLLTMLTAGVSLRCGQSFQRIIDVNYANMWSVSMTKVAPPATMYRDVHVTVKRYTCLATRHTRCHLYLNSAGLHALCISLFPCSLVGEMRGYTRRSSPSSGAHLFSGKSLKKTCYCCKSRILGVVFVTQISLWMVFVKFRLEYANWFPCLYVSYSSKSPLSYSNVGSVECNILVTLMLFFVDRGPTRKMYWFGAVNLNSFCFVNSFRTAVPFWVLTTCN